MYLWQRRAAPKWWQDHETEVRDLLGSSLVLVELPAHKHVEIQFASASARQVQKVQQTFGGRVRKLPRDWLERFAREQANSAPIRIGRRLIITNAANPAVARQTGKASERKGVSRLFIPAGAAFGTGRHATTAMCLRLLERSLKAQPAALLVDLGTGSGILAVAARKLGAARVIGIDSDPIAISTAQENARQNGSSDISFREGDVLRWKLPRGTDLVVANLFSELLIRLLPRLRSVPRLILSGVLRTQQDDLLRALRRHQLSLCHLHRRGKWIALEAKN